MTDKRIDAHTNTTTVADVDEFIVDSGSNGTRNITYSNLKSQILGSTSIATIGNSVTEAIYNTYTDIGDLTQTGVTGATVAAQISQLNDEIGVIDAAKADTYVSPSRDAAQSFNVGTATYNRMFLLSVGYASSYQFGIVFINYSGSSINYTSVSSTYLTVNAITYNNGTISVTFSETPYSNARLIRLC